MNQLIPSEVTLKVDAKLDPSNLVKPGIYAMVGIMMLIVFAVVVKRLIG